MKLTKRIFLLIIGIIYMGTSFSYAAATPIPKTPTITVWVHGTKSREFLMNRLSEFTQSMEDALLGCKQGLHKITSLRKKQNHYLLAKELSDGCPE